MLVNHAFSDEAYDTPGNTNIAIAAMVTAYARIKLYSIIDNIEASNSGRVLYFDTDSVIFKDTPAMNWYVPEIGDFLGDMTDEIEKDYGPNAFIKLFRSGDTSAVKNVAQLQFRSDKLHSVFTSIFQKKYRAVSEKRVVLKEGDIQTLPFGYKFN